MMLIKKYFTYSPNLHDLNQVYLNLLMTPKVFLKICFPKCDEQQQTVEANMGQATHTELRFLRMAK